MTDAVARDLSPILLCALSFIPPGALCGFNLEGVSFHWLGPRWFKTGPNSVGGVVFSKPEVNTGPVGSFKLFKVERRKLLF
jgi:hypothetical protein